jgi:hypothetical protein
MPEEFTHYVAGVQDKARPGSVLSDLNAKPLPASLPGLAANGLLSNAGASPLD